MVAGVSGVTPHAIRSESLPSTNVQGSHRAPRGPKIRIAMYVQGLYPYTPWYVQILSHTSLPASLHFVRCAVLASCALDLITVVRGGDVFIHGPKC